MRRQEEKDKPKQSGKSATFNEEDLFQSSSSDDEYCYYSDSASGIGNRPYRVPTPIESAMNLINLNKKPSNPPKINTNKSHIFTIKNNDDELVMGVSRIRLFIQMHPKLKNTITGCICEIKSASGTKAFVYVDGSQATAELMLRAKSMKNSMMTHNLNEGSLDWRHHQLFYAQKTIQHYKHYTDLFIEILKKLVFKQNTDTDSILLIDAGCGQNPKLIVNAYEQATVHFKNVAALALEPQKESIAKCQQFMKKNYADSKYSGIQFQQARSQDIESLIKRFNTRIQPKKRCTVAFSSGTLTRHTIESAFACVDILQAFSRANVDYIISSGQSATLFNDRILSKIGFKLTLQDSGPPIHKLPYPAFVTVAMSKEEIAKRIAEKFAKDDVLDVSFSPDSHERISLVKKEIKALVPTVQKIDLSFAHLHNIGNLLEKLTDTFSKLDTIVCKHHNMAMLTDLIKATQKTKFTLIPEYVDDEMAIAFSAASAKLYGYDYDANKSTRSLIYNHIIKKLSSSNESFSKKIKYYKPIIAALETKRYYFDSLLSANSSSVDLDKAISNFLKYEQVDKLKTKVTSFNNLDMEHLLHLVRLNDGERLNHYLLGVLDDASVKSNLVKSPELMDRINQAVYFAKATNTPRVLAAHGLLSGQFGSPLTYIAKEHNNPDFKQLPSHYTNLSIALLDANPELLSKKDHTGTSPKLAATNKEVLSSLNNIRGYCENMNKKETSMQGQSNFNT